MVRVFFLTFMVRKNQMPIYILEQTLKTVKDSTICGLLGLNPNALWDDTGLIKLLKDRG